MNIMLIITMFSQYQKFNKILVKLHVNNFGDRNARTLLSSLEFVDLLLCLLKGICYWENDACAHRKWRSIEDVNPKLRWPVFLNNVCVISSESSPSLIIITWYVLTLIITGILYFKNYAWMFFQKNGNYLYHYLNITMISCVLDFKAVFSIRDIQNAGNFGSSTKFIWWSVLYNIWQIK